MKNFPEGCVELGARKERKNKRVLQAALHQAQNHSTTCDDADMEWNHRFATLL